MAFVILERCSWPRTEACTSACQDNAIHPKRGDMYNDSAPQLFIDPLQSTNCGACMSLCPAGAIVPEDPTDPDVARSLLRAFDYFGTGPDWL